MTRDRVPSHIIKMKRTGEEIVKSNLFFSCKENFVNFSNSLTITDNKLLDAKDNFSKACAFLNGDSLNAEMNNFRGTLQLNQRVIVENRISHAIKTETAKREEIHLENMKRFTYRFMDTLFRLFDYKGTKLDFESSTAFRTAIIEKFIADGKLLSEEDVYALTERKLTARLRPIFETVMDSARLNLSSHSRDTLPTFELQPKILHGISKDDMIEYTFFSQDGDYVKCCSVGARFTSEVQSKLNKFVERSDKLRTKSKHLLRELSSFRVLDSTYCGTRIGLVADINDHMKNIVEFTTDYAKVKKEFLIK